MPALTSHPPDSIIAWRRRGDAHEPVTAGRFVAEAQALAAQLPAGGHVLNICQDRYRFMVGLAAGMLAGKISLQPSSFAPETVRQLLAFAPDTFCLHDGQGDGIDLPKLHHPGLYDCADATVVPDIDAAQIVACVFTSGSTGAPVPHRKTWGKLVRNAAAGAVRLGVDTQPHAIVGTVPGQHMYGFESTVLLSLHGNCAAWSGRPFYPADIVAALETVPRPRLLVTTPFHLRSLLDADIALPAVDQLLSATAPLSTALAREAEDRFGAPLHEIYGCTETGQIASRRTLAESEWTLLRDVVLDQQDGITWASGGHIEGRVALADIIEPLDAQRFRLHGRNADLVNIAGKRTSLAYLNHQLAAIDGVQDGAFFMPDGEAADGITRLAACVVAPDLAARELLAALRQRIDPIFLPRPLLFVAALPRNATGKLPRQELQSLLAVHGEGR